MKTKTNRPSTGVPLWQGLLDSGIMAWRDLFRQPLVSLAAIGVIAATLVLPLALFSAADKLQSILAQNAQNPRLIAYLRLDGGDSLIRDVSERLLLMDAISFIEPVPKAMGLAQLANEQGFSDLINELESNPLPDVLIITPLISDISELQALSDELTQDPDIDAVELNTQWLLRLRALADTIQTLGQNVALLSGLAFCLVIGTTMGTLIQTNSDEIRIQKLIGATDFYVIKPLIFKGFYYGLNGALLALLLQLGLFAALNSSLSEFMALYSDKASDSDAYLGLSLSVSLIALGASCTIGAAAAFIFARRQLLQLSPA